MPSTEKLGMSLTPPRRGERNKRARTSVPKARTHSSRAKSNPPRAPAIKGGNQRSESLQRAVEAGGCFSTVIAPPPPPNNRTAYQWHKQRRMRKIRAPRKCSESKAG